MTNEEKRLKIKKIDKYKEEIEAEEKKEITRAVLVGICTIGAVVLTAGATKNEAEGTLAIIATVIMELCSMADAAFAVIHFKELLKSIQKNTMLKSKIEDLKLEIEIDDLKNESDVKRR